MKTNTDKIVFKPISYNTQVTLTQLPIQLLERQNGIH